MYSKTFISKLRATGDCIGGHFTGLVREHRKGELHCKRMTFTCIFTFIHSCCRMEAAPSERAGRLERSQPGVCIKPLLVLRITIAYNSQMFYLLYLASSNVILHIIELYLFVYIIKIMAVAKTSKLFAWNCLASLIF